MNTACADTFMAIFGFKRIAPDLEELYQIRMQADKDAATLEANYMDWLNSD